MQSLVRTSSSCFFFVVCFAAIAPDVSLEVVDFDPLTVSFIDTTYSVEVGHDFQVSCVSTGNFSGEVTWYKIGVDGGGEYVYYVCVHVCVHMPIS